MQIVASVAPQLARGGVPVAFEVAKALGASLDVCVVRKLGVPYHPELAMGAIASGGVRILNDEVLQMAHIPQERVVRSELKREYLALPRPVVAW